MTTLRILLLPLLTAGLLHAESPVETPAHDPDAPGAWRLGAGEERNLIVNGNFERGTQGWELIAFAKKGTMTIDKEELHDGKPTLRVENVEGDQSFVRQIVKGKPNTRYRLTGYIKTKDVEPVRQGGKDGAVLMVGMTLDMTPSIQKTQEWRKVTLDFVTKDKTEIRVGSSLGTYARYVTGTAWFSDLTLTELGHNARR